DVLDGHPPQRPSAAQLRPDLFHRLLLRSRATCTARHVCVAVLAPTFAVCQRRRAAGRGGAARRGAVRWRRDQSTLRSPSTTVFEAARPALICVVISVHSSAPATTSTSSTGSTRAGR